MTNPNPGTNSLPFGTSGAFNSTLAVPAVVVILGATEFTVEFGVLVEAGGEVLCTVATEVAGVSTVVCNAVSSCTITGSCGINGAVVTCAIGLIGFNGLIGLTGDSTFVGFVIDFTHSFKTTIQGPNTGFPYGSGQLELLDS